MLYALGQKFLNIMEILIDNDVAFETNEKISIGTENRSKILSVLGRVQYKKIPDDLADTVPTVIDAVVAKEEERFVRFINTAGPLNYKNHALKAIPQIRPAVLINLTNATTASMTVGTVSANLEFFYIVLSSTESIFERFSVY